MADYPDIPEIQPHALLVSHLLHTLLLNRLIEEGYDLHTYGPPSQYRYFRIALFDPTKKKKKKKGVAIQHHVDDSVYSCAEKAIEGGRNIFVGLQKEKRSPLQVGNSTLLDNNSDAAEDMCDSDEEDEEEDALVQQSRNPWEGSESSYEYKELLQRLFGFLHEHNPQLAEDKRRSVLRPPLVLPEGTTKTVFVNFADLCQMMHRQPKQLISFISTELGTTGSLDGENRLVVRGRFAPKVLEDLLQRYINEYVLCNICRSPDSSLSKENHIVLLQCDMCGSEKSVAPIGAGYGSRVERRKLGL